MRTFSRILKMVSALTLFFFCWTYMPLYAAVAWAAEPPRVRNMERADRVGVKDGNTVALVQRPEEKFEKALEAVREKIDKAQEKAVKNQDATAEVAEVKAKRTEIEKIDIELRKEFSGTEKKLRDAKLPKEILDRHYKFVKHYEDNLAELKANLEEVGKYAVGSKQGREALKKAKAHLDKTKPPTKHVPLDPNKLPFRTVKAKERAPRLKKEEFEKDFPSHKKAKKLASVENTIAANDHPRLNYSGTGLLTRIKHKPIQLAFNDSGTFSDQPVSFRSDRLSASSSTSINDFIPQLALSDSTPILLAQAADAPTADDLAENGIEIQFTDDIKAKAAELGYSPVKIYEWVRNNIEFVPTYGSIQGADMCLQTKICNDFDTASLLIALLRTSGISARYVYGTVEIPIDKVMNWVGGVTDYKMAGTILATNGIPVTLMKTSGGVYKNVQMEHVYVKAFIDYIPSRGAVHKQGDTWIPLDPSYKQYTYTQGIDISSAVPFDAQTFVSQLQSTATINETEGYVTNVDSAYIQQAMQDYQTQVQDYITQNHPNATVGDVIGKKEIVKQEFPYLMGTLPYKTIQIGSEFADVPAKYRATLTFEISDMSGSNSGFSYTSQLPSIAGKKITLSYDPATQADSDLLNRYGGDVTKVPPYLLTLRPVIKIDGATVASGPQMQLGVSHDFIMAFYDPGIGTDRVQNVFDAGGYSAIVVEPQRFLYSILETNALKFKSTLEAMKAQLNNGEQPVVERDKLIGDWLWLQGLYYFYAQGKMLGIAEWLNGVTAAKGISAAITSAVPSVTYLFSIPKNFDLEGYGIDVDRNIFTVFSKTGDQEKTKQFMETAGYISSGLEHNHAETLSKIPAISTISLLNAANKAGIPIYTITSNNIATILPKLQVSSDVIADINNAIGAGKIVTVPARAASYYGSVGVGYIIQDPFTGAGAYKISGGSNGGWQALTDCLKDILLMFCNIGAPSAGYAFSVEALSWIDSYLESGNALNWSSMTSADIWFIAIMTVISLMLAFFLVVLAVWFPVIIFAASILFQFFVKLVQTSARGRAWWCALPCAPVIIDAYQFWFGDINYNNPCY